MHDPHLEHVPKSTGDLQDVRPNFDLRDELVRLSNLLDVVLEVSFFGPLNCNEHLIILNETFQVFRYVSVLQLFHELHLLYAIVSLFDVVDIEYLEQFERNELFCLDVLGLENEGELALPDGLQDLIVSVNATIKVTVSDGSFAALFYDSQIVRIGSLVIALLFSSFQESRAAVIRRLNFGNLKWAYVHFSSPIYSNLF